MKLSNFLLPSPAWLSSLFSLLIAILLGLQALEANFTDFFGTVDCPECITAMQKAFTGITFIVALMKPFTAMKQSFLSNFIGGISGTKRDQNGRFISTKGGATTIVLLLFCSTLLSCNTQPSYYTEEPTYSTPIVNTHYVHNTSPAYSTPVYVHSPSINIHRTTVVKPRASFYSRIVKPTVTVNKTVVRPARTNYRSTSFRSFASRPSFSSRRR